MSRVPNQVLEQIACEITEHTKQLGLFDDLRMKLLDSIQTSKDFLRLRGEFKRELDSFCTRADLSLARAKLRERLTEKTLYKSAGKLRELVEQQVSSRHQRHVIRQMYTHKALEFLRSSKKPTSHSLTSSKQIKDSEKLEVEDEEELIEAGPPSASSSSSVESFADSGLGSSGGTLSSPSPVNRISKASSKRNNFDSSKSKNSKPKLKLEPELEYKHESFSSRLADISLMPLAPQTCKRKKSKDKTRHKCSQLSNHHCDSSIESDLTGKQQFQNNQTEQAHSRKRPKYHSTSSRSSHSSSSSFLKVSSIDSATNHKHSIKRA